MYRYVTGTEPQEELDEKEPDETDKPKIMDESDEVDIEKV
jgi:hypothetical protein